MDNMGYLETCTDLGLTAAEIQARLPAHQLDARFDAAGLARRHRPSDSDSPFRPRPNYAVPSGLYGCQGRKLSSFLAALLFAASGGAQAATVNAASPSLANITAAIASAVDGDTVIVPAGTASWTSGLSITKGITLMGQTTTDPGAKTANDQTIILDNVVRGPGGTPIIKVQSSLGKSYRISGITFRPGTVTDTNYNGLIHLEGNSHAVRLDHCHFATMIYQPVDIATYGAIYGVIDHNVMEFFTGIGESIFMTAATWGGLTNSYGSWAEPAYYGSEKFLFIEDNCFNNNQTGHELAGTLDSERGARWVFRYNHCYNTEVQSHGTEGDQERGSRAIEVYNNDFHLTESTQFGQIRTGSIIVHDNTFDGAVPASGMVLETYRAFFAYRSGPWGGSSGDNVWDVNATEADGTHVDGHPPYLFESGTVTSGNTTTLTDTTKSWTTNQWVGFTAKRASDNQIAYIQSNTSNTLRVYYYNDSGRGATWTAGDQYQIHKVLISLDQPGRGQGDLLTGDTPIDSVTRTATWPHQALEPCYSWNDIYTPNGTHLNLQAGTGNQGLLLEGRDFYNNTAMPGYTPYTYPHPLATGGGDGPGTPQRLHVVQ